MDDSAAAKSLYPSQVKKTAYGKGLFVTKDLAVISCLLTKG